MKIKRLIPIIIMLYSCNNSHKESDSPLHNLISHLPVLNSSYTYVLNKQDTEDCYELKGNDTLFYNPPYPIVGLLSDTNDNYKIIHLDPGDDLYPTLRIFDKQGKIIDEQNICYYLCAGWDCTMDSCESFIKILDGRTIERYLKSTTTDCDSVGTKIPSTTKTETKRQKIKVGQNGKIIFEVEIDK